MHDFSLYLLELLENSLRAEATQISIGLLADRASDQLRVAVEDDGTGLETSPKRAVHPFYTTKKDRKTGLGLSLLQAEAEAAGGRLIVEPTTGSKGLRVNVEMVLSHVDRPPIGDIAGSIAVMAITNPEVIFTVSLWGDQFDPPLIGVTPEAARESLKRVTQQLDQMILDKPRTAQGVRRSQG
ncbi:MAG: ATP-binding protein [Actinobacteria bacterium]|nr:ATP-binding protein [Actinomycetota bacterium]